MGSLNVVQILGTGLSGFGFLLMYLAYKLIKDLLPLPKVDAKIISTINRYMLVCSVMTVIVGGFTFMSTYYKNGVISNQAAMLKSKDTVLNILAASQQSKLLSDSVVSALNSHSLAEIRSRQSSYLDTLQKYVMTKHDTVQNARFYRFKASLASVTDSLAIGGLDEDRKSLLKERFVLLNDSITKLSLRAANNRVASFQ